MQHAIMRCVAMAVLSTWCFLAEANSLSLATSSASYQLGDSFTVDVAIAGGADIYGYQFDLSYNPVTVRTTSIQEGPYLPAAGSTLFIPGSVDSAAGRISSTAATLLTAIPGNSGSGDLVQFTFEALTAGVSTFSLSSIELLDSNLNVIDVAASSKTVTIKTSPVTAPELVSDSWITSLTLSAGLLAVMSRRRVS